MRCVGIVCMCACVGVVCVCCCSPFSSCLCQPGSLASRKLSSRMESVDLFQNLTVSAVLLFVLNNLQLLIRVSRV